MIEQDKNINDYILAHIDEEPAILKELYRDAKVNLLHAKMISGHLQGRMLKMFAQMIQAKYILELGTFTGYATLCLAEGAQADAEIHTIEIFDELETFIRKYFDRSEYRDNIHLHIGDTFEILPQLDCVFDLVYIDANKRNYCEYYDAVFDKVRSGGLILADNTLWYGKVVEDTKASDKQSAEIKKFNDKIKDDTRVEKIILPMRDGLTVMMKK